MMLALTKAYILGFYAQSPSFGVCEGKTQQGWAGIDSQNKKNLEEQAI